jgi:hypothetical protein
MAWPDFASPFGQVENEFLQLLLTDFALTRQSQGIEMNVSFGEETPTIWSRKGRVRVRQQIPDFEKKSTEYQRRLDAFLLEGRGDSYRHKDDDFPFRYASGGALPVIRIDGKEYYCLFYRDIYPVGWNIANGGTDTRFELQNPVQAIERELREELIVVDPEIGRDYVLEHLEQLSDHPDCVNVRRLLEAAFPYLTFSQYKRLEVPLKWLEGPDRVNVSFGGKASQSSFCFLNINALDFGIELDRVAKLNVSKDVVLVDGETYQGLPLNQPIGLFLTDSLNERLRRRHKEFEPDLLFWSGQRRDATELRPVVHQYLEQARRSDRARREYDESPLKFGLCPVTERIIRRYMPPAPDAAGDASGPKGSTDIFISFASEDKEVASRLYTYFVDNAKYRVFFSDCSIYDSNFGREIDAALDSSLAMVVVASRVEHLMKGWVEFEWRSFFQRNMVYKRGRAKNPQLVSFVRDDIKPFDLPSVLALHQTMTWPKKENASVEPAFGELLQFLNRCLNSESKA